MVACRRTLWLGGWHVEGSPACLSRLGPRRRRWIPPARVVRLCLFFSTCPSRHSEVSCFKICRSRPSSWFSGFPPRPTSLSNPEYLSTSRRTTPICSCVPVLLEPHRQPRLSRRHHPHHHPHPQHPRPPHKRLDCRTASHRRPARCCLFVCLQRRHCKQDSFLPSLCPLTARAISSRLCLPLQPPQWSPPNRPRPPRPAPFRPRLG
jgi:hypothetical protein